MYIYIYHTVAGVCCCRHDCHNCGTRSRGGVAASADSTCGIQEGCGTKTNAEPSAVAEPNAVPSPKTVAESGCYIIYNI